MAGSSAEDYSMGGGSSVIEGMSNEQRCQSADSLAEWRSSEQVENGTPSTSPPYWDTDEDDDECVPKPPDLYGKFTWKIKNFSEINKRELRSDSFEVGGYKWYILIYPQGCDVSNHLSLFLCVFDHDKLLPGWSHFAQFTIAVVNKDSSKSKYSDTLHRFWKKEHDWGWKKFMELSKVSDGFIVSDTLVIKAQVQVIREKAHRPFRCLDRNYRRELVRVYLSNVEGICRRFVEERKGKLSKLIEDKMRWSSFRAFWSGVDQIARRRMSRDRSDTILKAVVKHFFVEKEVTSTLVMDSLYSGFKALECQSKSKKEVVKVDDVEELPAPMVYVEKDMFVLADDVLLLLERAAVEPLPHQPTPPKDDKGLYSRSKDASSGEELNKDSIQRDERRLTELGRRTVEIFVLAHIFSRIEIAYQEAVAFKRQEELIREEEAAGIVENELKAKRNAAEKEKWNKRMKAKQKRNTRKTKERGRFDKSDIMMQEAHQPENPSDIGPTEENRQAKPVIKKLDIQEDASDVSDTDAPESLQPELDDRDTDTLEIHPAMETASGSERQNGQTQKKSPPVIEDSCSTCSTDSVPSVVMNGSHRGNSLLYSKSQMSPLRGKSQRGRDNHKQSNPSPDSTAHLCDEADSCRSSQAEPVAVLSLKDRIHRLEKHLAEKEEEAISLQKKLNVKDQIEAERSHKSRIPEPSSSPASPVKKAQYASQPPKKSSENMATATVTMAELVSGKELPPPMNTLQTEKSTPPAIKPPQISPATKLTTSSRSSTTHQVVPAMSRPQSAPLIPSPRPTAPVVSMVQATPLLSRSVSATGRLATTDPSPSAPSNVPQSYRNAIVGKTTTGASPVGFTSLVSSAPSSSQGIVAFSQAPSSFLSSASILPAHTSARNGTTASQSPGFTFGSVKPEALRRQHSWRDDSSIMPPYGSNLASDISRLDINVSSSGAQGSVSDEFPHLAIINDLLDEEPGANGHHHQHHSFNRQYTYPLDASTTAADVGTSLHEQYYGEVFQRAYGSPLHGLRDGGASQSQWPYNNHHAAADPSMLNLGGVDANGYSYQFQDYLNLTTGAENGGYNMYRSSSGN